MHNIFFHQLFLNRPLATGASTAGRPDGIPGALAGRRRNPNEGCGKQPHCMTHPVFLDEDTCAKEMSLNGGAGNAPPAAGGRRGGEDSEGV